VDQILLLLVYLLQDVVQEALHGVQGRLEEGSEEAVQQVSRPEVLKGRLHVA
jgi:hypothetical protein